MRHSGEVAAHLGEAIGTWAREIERRWLERVQHDIARTPDIELTHLRDGIPDYLAALQHLLQTTTTTARATGPTGREIWSTIAREHGITRVRIGFDIGQLIHEFIVLRHVIRNVALEHGVPMADAEGILADLIEEAIVEAVQAYVDARDYQARQIQAENIGFLTHELRNPLTTATQAESVLRLLATPKQQAMLDALARSHQRLAVLIDSVLAAERLEAGKLDSHPEDLRLDAIIEPAIEAARKTAAEKHVEMHVAYDPRVCVRLDPALTRSAIENLADNAVKYTDVGRVDITVEESEHAVTVHVRDTCPGLSHAELATIFEPFRRGSTSKAGTGLGLSIARRATEAQGGSIHAESPGSSGCHFWITLPKQPAASVGSSGDERRPVQPSP